MDNPSEDRISLLPEFALRHILCFLDTKEAVQTSILARSWRYLWVSLPVLNLDYDTWNQLSTEKDNQENFITSVDRLLLCDYSGLRKLYLSCGDFCNERLIRAWVTAALGRYVEDIQLKLVSKEVVKLPDSIFTSGVKILKIISYHLPVQMPISMCSSLHLKKLELIAVKLPHGLENGQVHLECPGLESLRLSNCDHCNIQVLKISTPKLEKLVTENECGVDTDSSNTILNLCTPNLKSFEVQGHGGYKEYRMENVPSLASPSLLRLSASFLDHQVMTTDAYRGVGCLLRCQSFVHLKSVTLWDIEGSNDEFRYLKCILENAMLLSIMTITTQPAVKADKENYLMEFSEKLHASPRASSSVSILFVLRAYPTAIHRRERFRQVRPVGFHRDLPVSRQLQISSE